MAMRAAGFFVQRNQIPAMGWNNAAQPFVNSTSNAQHDDWWEIRGRKELARGYALHPSL